jgi:hypothetical protein
VVVTAWYVCLWGVDRVAVVDLHYGRNADGRRGEGIEMYQRNAICLLIHSVVLLAMDVEFLC